MRRGHAFCLCPHGLIPCGSGRGQADCYPYRFAYHSMSTLQETKVKYERENRCRNER